ncbi:MAG TPA: TetR/AcrR family transcriptional regulator [Feifaniaceae bacterium]|nr:TetR/AcrR family transcriptional regulator [Feifaniaceae bacterium]
MEFSSPHATKVFLRLAPEKQKKIFDAAAAEFAQHGFDSANTNVIARRAGVSVGSLFQYFVTKQELLLALVDYGTQTLLVPVIESMREPRNALALFRHMLVCAREFAQNYPDYNRVYLGVTAALPSPMATQLARRIEERTIASYRRAIRRDTEETGIKEGCLAFLMDNLVMSFQFSFASEYYHERLIAYTGIDPHADGDRLIAELCGMVEKLLRE